MSESHSPQEFDPGPDPSLRAWLDDALAHGEADAAANPVVPDFGEVVMRAHTMDPEAVGFEQVEEARSLAVVIPLGVSIPEDPGPDAALSDFLADVRADGAGAAQERGLAAIPELPVAAANRTQTRPRSKTPAFAAAAAAVLLLGVGIAGAMSALRDRAESPAMQSEYAAVPHDESGTLPARRSSTAEPVEPEIGPTPDEGPAVPEPESAEDSVDTSGEAKTRPTGASKVQKPSGEDRLRLLDEEAQRLWKAGDIPGAEKLFRQIIRIGKRGHFVQLAYGDLFNIARQKTEVERRKLWKTYLRAFPKGRHADDARGGLCRTAAENERGGCWERYLSDLPHGSYRRQALRALETTP